MSPARCQVHSLGCAATLWPNVRTQRLFVFCFFFYFYETQAKSERHKNHMHARRQRWMDGWKTRIKVNRLYFFVYSFENAVVNVQWLAQSTINRVNVRPIFTVTFRTCKTHVYMAVAKYESHLRNGSLHFNSSKMTKSKIKVWSLDSLFNLKGVWITNINTITDSISNKS